MKKLILLAGIALAAIALNAQTTELNIERSVKVEFNSQKGYSYDVYGTSDPARKTGWKLLGGEEGTGENIVFFYRSDSDQKVFFKVDAKPSEGGQNPQQPQPQASIVPITSLPPAESSGTYNLGEAIGESEVGGVYRMGISPGTDGDGLRNFDEYNMGWNPTVNDWKGPFFALSNLFALDTGGGLMDKTLMPRLVQHGRFAFSFFGKDGKVYEVQDSFNLRNWEPIRTYNGTGVSIRFDEERDHDPPKWFYRVRVVE